MKTKFECMECGHKFSGKLKRSTVEVKCPKCHGYNVTELLAMWARRKAKAKAYGFRYRIFRYKCS